MTKARDLAVFDAAGVLTSTSNLNAQKLTGTLPALNASALTNLTSGNLNGALPNIDGSSLTGIVAGGITGADMWTLQGNETGNMTPISAAKVARCAEESFEKIGTGMTINGNNEFVFPETGKWLVKFNVVTYASSASDYVNCRIDACIDTGTFQNVAESKLGATTGVAFNTGTCEAILDVHDTAYVKVKFSIDHANTSNMVIGSNSANKTSMTFIRLADT
jgi:hypothetical protein